MKTARIATIDVFRALTMFLMLFVNDIPGIKQIPHWLLHAKMDEDMLGFSDIIFPCFLFVMGMSVNFLNGAVSMMKGRVRKFWSARHVKN